jgi:DNA-binding Lrp family transcriptional regulator
VEAFLYVRTQPGAALTVLGALLGHHGVRRAILVIGRWDILALIEAADMAALARTVLSGVHQLDGVVQTMTAPIVPMSAMAGVGLGFGTAGPPTLLRGDASLVHLKAAPGTVPELLERLAEMDEVTGIAAIAGPHDLLVEIRRPWDVASQTILEKIHPLPGVRSTETMMALDAEEFDEDRDQFSAWE